MSRELALLGLAEAAALVRDRKVSPVELVDAVAAQADRWEPHIQSLIVRMDDQARAGARAAEAEIAAGRYRGPLHGIPVTIKDVMDVAGVPTTVASPILADNVPDASCVAVQRLEQAGALVAGKANTHQFTWGGDTPPTRNPWDVARIPGGSSGGSGAGMAACIGYGSLGSDTAASVRSPAAYNGVVGLKTTYGRIPKSGFFPLAWSMDSVGPLARRVEDVALLLDAISGWDASDPSAVPGPMAPALPTLRDGVKGLRIGVPEDYFWRPIQSEVDAELRRGLDALRDAGAIVTPVTIAGGEHLPLSVAVSFVLIIVESAAWHRSWLDEKPWGYAPDVYEYISWAKRIPATDFVDAQRVRRLITDVIDRAFTGVDLLAVPTQAQVASRIDTPEVTFSDGTREHRDPAGIRSLAIFNLTGHPGVSVPVGRGADTGMPVGLQLVARRGEDATALRAAQAVEERLGTLGEPPLPA
jgi:aspartyl-tRNA(Asn)/glutamyl-tRNA(Gln) amidotransferase subunit A